MFELQQIAQTANRINAFQFTSLQEVIDNSSTYPNSAYVALRLDSKQFNNIPTRKYRIRGLKVRIPGAGASNSGTPTVDNATGRIVYPSGYIFNGVLWVLLFMDKLPFDVLARSFHKH